MFIPHSIPVTAEVASQAEPKYWMLMMHGIYGRGGNWKTAARRITAERPDWGVLLVDLRMHGRSKGAEGPHTVAACAKDVLALIGREDREGRKIAMVAGHSFGGKVALSVHKERPNLPIWLFDSGPGPRPGTYDDPKNTVMAVLRMMEALPETFASRAEFQDLVVEKGFGRPLAAWLGMNLEACPEGYRNALDTSAMRDLLRDYFAVDLWPAIESSETIVHVAIASRGSSITQESQARLRDTPHVQAHLLDGGHWLHVDALDALVTKVVASLV